MVGFHTYDYARHFVTACSRILGLDTTPAGVYYDGRFVPVSVFPVGIEPDKFEKQLQSAQVQAKIEHYTKAFEGKKVSALTVVFVFKGVYCFFTHHCLGSNLLNLLT